MGAQIGQLLADKITSVEREFETADGPYELKLMVRHKRITSEVQEALKEIAEREYEKLADSLKDRQDLIEKYRKANTAFKTEDLPMYRPQNVVCLQLEYLVKDLDIVDEKKKPLKPTYENLKRLPTEVTEAIKEEIDNSVMPKKKTLPNLVTGMLPGVGEDAPTVG